MLTTLRTLNTRVVGARSARSSDVHTSSQHKPASVAPSLNYVAYLNSARQTRMVSMAQAWTRKTPSSQLEASLKHQQMSSMMNRSVHTSTQANAATNNPLAHGAWSVTPKSVGSSKNVQLETFQTTAWIMAAALPAGLMFSPSILNLPIDLILGFVVPFHAWYGCHHVVEDYMPASYVPSANMLLYLLTALAVLGLLNLNLRGDGILETIKGLWREDKKDDQNGKKSARK